MSKRAIIDKDLLKRLYLEGKTHSELGIIFGVHGATIFSYLKKEPWYQSDDNILKQSKPGYLAGKTIGKTKVISAYKDNAWRGIRYICVCGYCNKEFHSSADKIHRHKSCGCIMRTGNEFITGQYWASVKRHAYNRGYKFDISMDYAAEIFRKQNGRCALSNVKINPRGYNDDKKSTASLDRINSNYGYIKGNVQWVHQDINIMKWDFGQQEFINYCTKIALHKNSNTCTKIKKEFIPSDGLLY